MSNITAALVKELRERTGAGMMECKKALVDANGDLETAITELRKKGIAKAAKRAGKTAAEGTVVIATSADNKQAVVVEVNCETDFVARDSGFKAFAEKVANLALTEQAADVEALLKASIAGKTLDDVRQELVTTIGENIQIRRIAYAASSSVVGSYIHGERIAVLVALNVDNLELAKDVAMHIAATNPRAIDIDDMPAELVAKEKEIFVAQAKESGKPDEIIEKMIAGRINKFVKENSLLGQAFVKNPEQTVGDLLKSQQATVEKFIRFEVGEGIEKEAVDFAAEVQAQMKG